MPDAIGWSEAIDLVRILRSDPSSQLSCAIEGWRFPLSREGWMLADLIDVQGSSKAGKKWKTYDKRPVDPNENTKTRRGNAAGRTREQVVAILREYGHGPPV